MSDQPDPATDATDTGSGNRDPKAYWFANLRLIAILLPIWALVSLVALWFAEPLNEFHVGQLPLGFWMVQQGAIYVFVALIFVYAWRMDRIDRDHGVEE